MKPINDELKELLKANNKNAILDTDNDVLKELDRLDTSREILYDEPEPDSNGRAEVIGQSNIDLFAGRQTITVYHRVFLYDWDEEGKEYLGSSSEIIGWDE